MVYKWKPVSPEKFERLNPQVVGTHLEALRVKHGGALKPLLLIEDGRRDDSPIHEGFEWNDRTAAHLHRLDQARTILQSLVVVVERDDNNEDVVTRAFVSVRDESGTDIYTSVKVAMSDDALRAQVLRRALQEIQRWKDKYEEYEELQTIFVAIEDTEKLVEHIQPAAVTA